MRNQYSGKCFMCGCAVGVGQGYFQNIFHLPKEIRKKYLNNRGMKWLLRCVRCVGAGNVPLKNNASQSL